MRPLKPCVRLQSHTQLCFQNSSLLPAKTNRVSNRESSSTIFHTWASLPQFGKPRPFAHLRVSIARIAHPANHARAFQLLLGDRARDFGLHLVLLLLRQNHNRPMAADLALRRPVAVSGGGELAD